MRVLVIAVILIAGCAQPPPQAEGLTPPPPTPPPQSCPASSTQQAEVTVSGYVLRTPATYNEGSGYETFRWTADPAHLVRLQLLLEWQADTPVTERLMVGVPNATFTPEYYAYGPFSGASPLTATIEDPWQGALGTELQVDHGAAHDQTPVGGAARPEQQARLTVTQTYDPCLRRG